MSASTPSDLPEQIVAGTTVTCRLSSSEFPVSAGYTIATLYLRGIDVLNKAGTPTVPAAAFDFALTAAETSALDPGRYQWWLFVETAGGVRKIGAAGTLEVLPDPRRLGAGDALSSAEQQLAIVKTKITERLSDDVASYDLEGTSAVREKLTELRRIEADLEQRVYQLKHPGRFGPPVRGTFTGVNNES